MTEEEYELQQNIHTALPTLLEALGYTTRYGMFGGIYIYKNDQQLIPDDSPTAYELKSYVENLISGQSVEEATQTFLATRDKLK